MSNTNHFNIEAPGNLITVWQDPFSDIVSATRNPSSFGRYLLPFIPRIPYRLVSFAEREVPIFRSPFAGSIHVAPFKQGQLADVTVGGLVLASLTRDEGSRVSLLNKAIWRGECSDELELGSLENERTIQLASVLFSLLRLHNQVSIGPATNEQDKYQTVKQQWGPLRILGGFIPIYVPDNPETDANYRNAHLVYTPQRESNHVVVYEVSAKTRTSKLGPRIQIKVLTGKAEPSN